MQSLVLPSEVRSDYAYIKSSKKRYKKIVIWGVKEARPGDSFHFIHLHFNKAFKHLGYEPIWVDDDNKNRSLVEPGSFVMGFNLAGENLPVVKGVDYCLHNFDEVGNIHDEIGNKNNIRLQVYTSKSENAKQKWGDVRYFEPATRTLFQPWGTDLMPEYFMKPVYPVLSPIMFWVGSVWNDANNQGNIEDIQKLKKVLNKYNVIFKQVRVGDTLATRLIRASRIAPAIAGKWQVDNNYLPCRLFKNVSYGQLGITNVPRLQSLFGDKPKGSNIEFLIEQAINMKRKQAIEIVKSQQEVCKNYTYVSSIANIFRALEKVS
jgi:hypothetical protein